MGTGNAVFGVSPYGVNLYGGTSTTVDLDAHVQARCTDYGRITVTWTNPLGGWSMLRLVRNANGAPRTVDDGELLVNDDGSHDQLLVDTDVVPGRWYTYSIFLFAYDVQAWVNAGASTVLVTRDYGLMEAMWDRLPQIYKVADPYVPGGITDAAGFLHRYLSLFAFQLDTQRSEYDALLDLANPARAPGSVLTRMLQQFGFDPEPSLGSRVEQQLARYGPQLYQGKGGRASLENVVTILTGWDAYYRPGVNRVLDSGDALIGVSPGRWATALVNATVVGRPNDPAIGSGLYGDGYAALRSGTGGAMSASFATTGTQGRLHGIRVTPALDYTASVWLRGARATTLHIDWYDRDGALLSTSDGTPVTPATGIWTARATVHGVAPVHCFFAGIRVSVVGTSTHEELYLNGVQFERGVTPSDYRSAREALVIVQAEQINQVHNPASATATTGWTGGTLSAGSPAGLVFTWSGGAQANAADYRYVRADPRVPVLPGQTWSMTVDISAAIDVDVAPHLRLFSGEAEVGTAHLGSTYYTHATAGWTTAIMTYTVPEDGSVTGIQAAVAFTRRDMATTSALTNGAQVKFRNVALVATTPAHLHFFDGAMPSPTADFMWEGTPYNSRSHFYSLRTLKAQRARDLTPRFLPNGVSAELVFAQPDFIGYGRDVGMEDLGPSA